MSASQENLPAIPAAEPVLEERTRKTLGDVRLLLVIGVSTIVGLFGGGWAALAAVDEKATTAGEAAAKKETAGIREEQASIKASLSAIRDEQKEQRAETADTKDEVRGLRKDLRRIFPTLPATDGGR